MLEKINKEMGSQSLSSQHQEIELEYLEKAFANNDYKSQEIENIIHLRNKVNKRKIQQ